jgi:hypothetical protein
MQATFEELLSPDNTIRKRAEAHIETEYKQNPAVFAERLVMGLGGKFEVASMCCVLLKKYFLDSRAATELADQDLENLRNALLESIDLDKQPLSLLKRKGDVLSKIYAKLNKTEMLLAYLVQLADHADPKVRQFAMYVFEVLSEIHLSSA